MSTKDGGYSSSGGLSNCCISLPNFDSLLCSKMYCLYFLIAVEVLTPGQKDNFWIVYTFLSAIIIVGLSVYF